MGCEPGGNPRTTGAGGFGATRARCGRDRRARVCRARRRAVEPHRLRAAAREAFALFGGQTNWNGIFPFNDLWEWDGSRWTHRAANSVSNGWTFAQGLGWLSSYKTGKGADAVLRRSLDQQGHAGIGLGGRADVVQIADAERSRELVGQEARHGAVHPPQPLESKVNRSVGAMLSGELIRRRPEGLPDHTIFMQMEGTGGQSFGAFLAKGITLYLIGDANDYTGKGLSGGRVVVRPSIDFRGDATRNIVIGNTLSDDGLLGKLFDYMLSNPPFGVEWKKIEREIRKEAEEQGFNGRFGPGLPRVSRETGQPAEALAEIERLKLQLEAENVYLREEIKTGKGFQNLVGSDQATFYIAMNNAAKDLEFKVDCISADPTAFARYCAC